MCITNELREAILKNMNNKLYVVSKANALLDIADHIDAEHERALSEPYNSLTVDMKPMTDENMAEGGWIRLPIDADGVYIHVGDILADGTGRIVPVAALELDDDCWAIVTDDGHAYRNPDTFTHHKYTLEDLLMEFGDKVCNSGHQWGLDAEDTVGEFAARIRQMMNDKED